MTDEQRRTPSEILAEGRTAGERIALAEIIAAVRHELQHDLDALTAANEVLTVKLVQCRDRLADCRDECFRLRSIVEGRE